MKIRFSIHVVTVVAGLVLGGLSAGGQTPATSAQIIETILSDAGRPEELGKLKESLTRALADSRLTDQDSRQLLTDSKQVVEEMLDQKMGVNTYKLVALAKWQSAQDLAWIALKDRPENPVIPLTPNDEFILQGYLGDRFVYLTSVIRDNLGTYLRVDRQNTSAENLEAFLQLYLSFPKIMEMRAFMADELVLYAPAWTQTRFAQMTVDQKREFLQSVQSVRARRLKPLGSDEEPWQMPTELVAPYEAAYQALVANTPPQ